MCHPTRQVEGIALVGVEANADMLHISGRRGAKIDSDIEDPASDTADELRFALRLGNEMQTAQSSRRFVARYRRLRFHQLKTMICELGAAIAALEAAARVCVDIAHYGEYAAD
jgi:hypothetical protein